MSIGNPGVNNMAEQDFIPVGRTSKIECSSAVLQIQTEYAFRPNPRLTTCVISRGQVLHKIQQDLEKPISSVEEKARVERMLQKQHAEVLRILARRDFASKKSDEDKPLVDTESLSIADKLSHVNGVVKIFRVDNNGNFDSSNVSETFKNYFKSIFRNVKEIMEIFSQLPGGQRESGVVEIERKRLYLVSRGNECFFLLVDGKTKSAEIESGVIKALYG